MELEPDPLETARRLRSAIAYRGLSQEDAARAIGVSLPTLARMIGREGSEGIRPASWTEIWRAADALDLPRAWFTADIARLQEIVPDGLPTFPADTGAFIPSAAHQAAAAGRTEQALAREAQRSREHQQDGRDTKPVRRGRRDAKR